jgi:hypothetical protein
VQGAADNTEAEEKVEQAEGPNLLVESVESDQQKCQFGSVDLDGRKHDESWSSAGTQERKK